MGLRPDGIAIDQPVELGYRCPVCVNSVAADSAGNLDERLHWSEYDGFLWCSVCNQDYPTVMCINLRWQKEHRWQKGGVDDAVDCYLDTVTRACGKALSDSAVMSEQLIELLRELMAVEATTACRYNGTQKCLTHPDYLNPCPWERAAEFIKLYTERRGGQ